MKNTIYVTWLLLCSLPFIRLFQIDWYLFYSLTYHNYRAFWFIKSGWWNCPAFWETHWKTSTSLDTPRYFLLASWFAYNFKIERGRKTILFIHWTWTVIRFIAFRSSYSVHIHKVGCFGKFTRFHCQSIHICSATKKQIYSFSLLKPQSTSDGCKKPSMCRLLFNWPTMRKHYGKT